MNQTTIKLKKDDQPLKVDSCSTRVRNLLIKDISVKGKILLLYLDHGSHHALLDFTGAADFQLLSFDDEGKFIGARLAINNAYGFMIQSQAHFVFLLPYKKRILDLVDIINQEEMLHLKNLR